MLSWSRGLVKRRPLLKILGLMLLGHPRGLQAQATPEAITVSQLENQALYRSNPEQPWATLRLGQSLYPRYELKTLENTRLILALGDGSEVRVAPNSYLRINSQTDPKVQQFDIQLLVGKAWAKLRKNLKLGTKLILRTAQASVDIQGTSYDATASAETTQVRVFSGQVAVKANPASGNGEIQAPYEIAGPQEVTREQWQVIVAAFYMVSVGNQGKTPAPQRFQLEAVQDEWVDWNLRQDAALEKR